MDAYRLFSIGLYLSPYQFIKLIQTKKVNYHAFYEHIPFCLNQRYSQNPLLRNTSHRLVFFLLNDNLFEQKPTPSFFLFHRMIRKLFHFDENGFWATIAELRTPYLVQLRGLFELCGNGNGNGNWHLPGKLEKSSFALVDGKDSILTASFIQWTQLGVHIEWNNQEIDDDIPIIRFLVTDPPHEADCAISTIIKLKPEQQDTDLYDFFCRRRHGQEEVKEDGITMDIKKHSMDRDTLRKEICKLVALKGVPSQVWITPVCESSKVDIYQDKKVNNYDFDNLIWKDIDNNSSIFFPKGTQVSVGVEGSELSAQVLCLDFVIQQ